MGTQWVHIFWGLVQNKQNRRQIIPKEYFFLCLGNCCLFYESSHCVVLVSVCVFEIRTSVQLSLNRLRMLKIQNNFSSWFLYLSKPEGKPVLITRLEFSISLIWLAHKSFVLFRFLSCSLFFFPHNSISIPF